MAKGDSGHNMGQRRGRNEPHGIGKPGEPPGPKDLDQRAEPESGARRDPLPREYKTELPTDVPGVTKKVRK